MLADMQPAGSVEEMLQQPFGRYLSGRTFIYFYPSREVNGFVAWGRPDEDDLRRLVRVLDAAFHPDAPPHLSYVDLRRLEGVDANAFSLLVGYLEAKQRDFHSRIRRQALLRPAGVPGAIVAGFYKVFEPTYPVQVFADAEEAVAWLGVEPALPDEIDRLVEAALGVPPTVRAVREAVEADLAGAELASVAKRLGMTGRTLQRRLHQAGTTFQAELNRAQVRVAQSMLLDTDQKLTAIASAVGCATLQHFSALFRKHTGESPSQWRHRHRRE
jgi:AraC-like DNA-binding protein